MSTIFVKTYDKSTSPLFQSQMSSSLTSPSKIATGLDGLAPTDNQYLGKIGATEKK